MEATLSTAPRQQVYRRSINDIFNLKLHSEPYRSKPADDMNLTGEELQNVLSACDNDDLLNIMCGFGKYGIWKLDIETSQVRWTEDVFRIHELPHSEGAIDFDTAVSHYHPEDQRHLPQLITEAISNRSAFRFVLRLKRALSGYKLVKWTGKYREIADGRAELIGTFSELQPADRAIAAFG